MLAQLQIQGRQIPNLYLARRREWHPAADSGTLAALGLTAAAFPQTATPGTPASDVTAETTALGMTSATFAQVVTEGQAATEQNTALAALGMTAATSPLA